MDWASPEPVLAIIAIITLGKLVKHAIYARKGLVAPKRRYGGEAVPADTAMPARLEAENTRLRTDYTQLEERTRVLERIVTDGGYSLANQIEALRGDTGGVPLEINRKETV